MLRPPCWRDSQSCPNDCTAQFYRRVIYNETPLYGPWSGWRFAGARLVSPHREWVTAPILDRWMWRNERMFR